MRPSLVLDFDGTVTMNDTTPLLPRSPTLLEPMTRDYLVDIERLTTESESARVSPEQELAHLDRIAEADVASVRRVSSSGILAMPLSERLAKAHMVSLRPGWSHFVEFASERGLRMIILSVNWSANFIRHILPDAEVHANEIRGDGVIVGSLHSSRDKVRFLGDLTGDVIYCGDSAGDLGALLAADVAIVLGDGLLPLLKRIGIAPTPAQSYERSKGGCAIAHDWLEVRDLVQRICDA